jgi:hypothetical protein
MSGLWGESVAICYAGSDVAVRLGDQVEIKVWFKRRRGRIVYVPGLSPLNTQYEFNGLRWIAIRTHNMLIGSIVHPQTEALKRKVKFIQRDDSPFDRAPDDPEYYAKHGGGWSP